MKSKRRGWNWVIATVLVVSGLMLVNLSAALGEISTDQGRSYDASVFTNGQPSITDTSALAGAIEVWSRAQNARQAQSLLARHVLIDTLLFAPAFCWLIWRSLRWLSDKPRMAAAMASAILISDELENAATFLFVRGLSTDHRELMLVQALTLLKWAFIGTAIFAMAAFAFQRMVARARDRG